VILGNNLTGTSSVKFNGRDAAFTVVSATEITTRVPTGATTGKIEVTTPSRKLSSPGAFHVTPQIFSFSPTSGPPGTTVTIAGESFTQAGAVTLTYKYPMEYTVDSDTQITATIPANGTTGEIRVRTPAGIAHRTAKFTVTQ
jgi:IPT/TIG domain